MSSSRINLIDIVTEQEFSAAPQGCVKLSSAETNWRAIVVETHSIPAMELQSHYVQGQSAHQYIMQNRIERAKKLIAVCKELNLTDIALQVGFYDQTHFGKAFKRNVGVAPKVFAKHQR